MQSIAHSLYNVFPLSSTTLGVESVEKLLFVPASFLAKG